MLRKFLYSCNANEPSSSAECTAIVATMDRHSIILCLAAVFFIFEFSAVLVVFHPSPYFHTVNLHSDVSLQTDSLKAPTLESVDTDRPVKGSESKALVENDIYSAYR